MQKDEPRTPNDDPRLPEDLQDEGRTLRRSEKPVLEELPPGRTDDEEHGG